MEEIRIFTGYDKREAVGLHVFMQSVIEKSSHPIAFTPITERFSKMVGGPRDGTNAFTYGRFMVPYFMGFKGIAIFADGVDMLCRTDIAELWEYANDLDNSYDKAALVVPHDYKTKSGLKYIGTPMESKNANYPRKNWSSLMVIYCSHEAWRELEPEKIKSYRGQTLSRLEFIKDNELIGDLPKEWNWLVGEYPFNVNAKMVHFTLGIPGFAHYFGVDFADEWRQCLSRSQEGLQEIKLKSQRLVASSR